MNMRLKTIDKLIGISFIGPYILSFVIAEFVLVMQFLWKYIDDITGKGISLLEILELVFYFSMTIVPKAIPITILLSSVFVFGNLSERFELTSMKSAGISLNRIMRMGMILAFFTTLFSIFASNVLVPEANYAFFSRFDAIRIQKPALSLEAKMFNEDFRGYKIYIDKKWKDEKTVEGILIYDHTSTDLSVANIISAAKGRLETTEDGKYFIMQLYDGYQYRELRETINPENMIQEKEFPFVRTSFKSWRKVFDMSEFDFTNRTVNMARRSTEIMNTPQLLAAIDSTDVEILNTVEQVGNNYNNIIHHKNLDKLAALDSIKIKTEEEEKIARIKEVQRIRGLVQLPIENLKDLNNFAQTFEESRRSELLGSAFSLSQRNNADILTTKRKTVDINFRKNRYILKLHQQYSWAVVCIIFLFIGAPLGSIIRKGGYGYPLLIAIVFFMVFIILMIMGEKLLRSQSIGPFFAAWLPCLVLIPIAIFFSIKALNDSKLFDGIDLTAKLDKWLNRKDLT